MSKIRLVGRTNIKTPPKGQGGLYFNSATKTFRQVDDTGLEVDLTRADVLISTPIDEDTVLSGATGAIDVDASSRKLTLTLPESVQGLVYDIKKLDDSNNTITIRASGTELIDGAPEAIITCQYENLRISGDGTGWLIR